MANRYKDPDELNNRYVPEDEDMFDDDDEIPEEELTEEEREIVKVFEKMTPEAWQTIAEWVMDEEDYTLSVEESHAKNILARLNTTNPNIDYDFKLAIVKTLYPDQAFHMVERLKKKPEEGANIPPEILEIIYAKAKEYKG